MSRTTVLLVVAALVVAGVPASAAFAQESTGDQPGETFAGVVGVQGAEVEGEVAGRALGQQLATADSNESKASVVASQTTELREQLTELEQRREDLRERYQSGNMSRGEYRAKLARLVAETRSLEARLNTTAATAEGLPEEALRQRGVNASAIAELRQNASDLTDGEAAEAAREVGGEGTGKGLAGDTGPPEDRGNADTDDRGPPENRGNAENATEDDEPGNSGNAADTADDRGNAANVTAGGDRGNGANASTGGDDRGNGTDASAGGDDRGNSGDAAGAGSANTNDGEAGDSDSDDRGNAGSAGSATDDGDRGNAGNADGRGNGPDDTSTSTATETEVERFDGGATPEFGP
ncbi:hypothetical protein [Halobaculum marinum]|uniref:DUF5667 domain-containing protein n=1 Tax=Halobaculum marinum TaxID=3031996 RepID=A0ABD5WX21_9EURY|nr:hypothetical protein [Halobaculum sp. DT55]